MRNILAFDLGSNTLRILEFNGKRVQEFEKIVTTAQDLAKNGYICEDAKNRVFNALNEASEIFDFSLPKRCVTTQALRVASNSSEFLAQIKERFGLEFEIISGEEEAQLTQIGVEFGLKNAKINSDNYTLFDLGGGSTEITCKSKDGVFSKSFNLGIVTLSQDRDFVTKLNTYADEIGLFLDLYYKNSTISQQLEHQQLLQVLQTG